MLVPRRVMLHACIYKRNRMMTASVLSSHIFPGSQYTVDDLNVGGLGHATSTDGDFFEKANSVFQHVGNW